MSWLVLFYHSAKCLVKMGAGLRVSRTKNWEGVKVKICVCSFKWKWLLPQLFYSGRVLVINNLIALTPWHRLNALTSLRGVIEGIQDFFSSEKYQIQTVALCLPVGD